MNKSNYVKSSCVCSCDEKLQPHNYQQRKKVAETLYNKKGWGSNMVMIGCDNPLNNVLCFDRMPLSKDIEPQNNSGFVKINSELEGQHLDKTFQLVNYGKNGSECETAYTSDDPRLIDVPRGMKMGLNSPPFNSAISIKKIYTDPRMKEYGKNYLSYSDINTGDIVYYVDKSIEDPFFKPNFPTKAEMKATLYRDPMGEIRPQFERYPIKPANHLNTQKCTYDGGLSWISDSQEFRQDLMSYQMRNQNEKKWSAMWSS